MIETSFTRLFGLRVPLQLAPLPFHAVPDLAVAFADAGGLAMLGMPMHSPAGMAAVLEAMASRSRGVYGVNFLVPFLDRDCLEVAADRARAVEFFYGWPDSDTVAAARRGGASVGWQVGSVGEAVAAEQAGCDYVVAQGIEAGGHVRGKTGLLALLGGVLERVRCPVVAAGGIGGAAQLAAVLAAGAGGARMGTRFLGAREADVHPRYRELLLAAAAEDTVLTEAFGDSWPDAPHRVLRSALEAARQIAGEVVGALPTPEGTLEIRRYSPISPSAAVTGAIEAMALYAGESVAAIERVQPTAEIVGELVDGAAELLHRVATAVAVAKS